MRLEQLAYVVAVVDEKSFSRAAERLGLAQPSLSRQIRLLEEELGVRLFHRGPGHPVVEVTAEGRVVLPFVRQVLADVEAVAVEARAVAGTEAGHLRVGATPSLTTSLLPGVLARFRARHRGVRLGVVEAGSRELVPAVAAGVVDVAFVVLPVDHPQVAATPLFDDRLVLAVGSGHPLAGRRQITLEELAGVPLVLFREGYDLREVTAAALRRAGVAPVVALEGGEMDGVLAFVGAGLGAAIVPELVVASQPGLRGLPFADPGLVRTVAVAYRSDRPMPRAAEALVEHLAGERWAELTPPGAGRRAPSGAAPA